MHVKTPEKRVFWTGVSRISRINPGVADGKTCQSVESGQELYPFVGVILQVYVKASEFYIFSCSRENVSKSPVEQSHPSISAAQSEFLQLDKVNSVENSVRLLIVKFSVDKRE